MNAPAKTGRRARAFVRFTGYAAIGEDGIMLKRTKALAVAALLALPGAALAHHGWNWTEDEETRLSGTIEEISFGNPHGHLVLQTADGLWQVDLAPPSANAAAGFVEGVAQPGDAAEVTGHRSKDAGDMRFKAETITVNGTTYDVYPSREHTLQPGS